MLTEIEFLEHLINSEIKFLNLTQSKFDSFQVLETVKTNHQLRKAFNTLYADYLSNETVIASEAKQSQAHRLLRRSAPRNDESIKTALKQHPVEKKLMEHFSEYLFFISEPFLSQHFPQLNRSKKPPRLPAWFYYVKGKIISLFFFLT